MTAIGGCGVVRAGGTSDLGNSLLDWGRFASVAHLIALSPWHRDATGTAAAAWLGRRRGHDGEQQQNGRDHDGVAQPPPSFQRCVFAGQLTLALPWRCCPGTLQQLPPGQQIYYPEQLSPVGSGGLQGAASASPALLLSSAPSGGLGGSGVPR